jgi:prepilin-type N-terminal cleavage/methylation domain-containing protein
MKEPATSRPSSDQGFSLVELLVVVAIIMIMAAVALPMVNTYLRVYKIRGASQELAKEIQGVRGKAISKNVNFGMVLITLDDHTYQWVSEDDLNPTDTEFSANVRVPLANALGGGTGAPSQRGPQMVLPRGIQFSKACPGLAGNWDRGMRFNRLGAWCLPGSTTDCPAITGVGADFILSRPATPGGAVVCLQQPDTGVVRTVEVGTGGRVLTQP